MKKWFLFFIIFAFVISAVLQLYKKYSSNDWVLEVITETKKIGLRDFLDYSHSGSFERIMLLDNVNLEGYEYLGTGKTTALMTLQKKVSEQEYRVYTTVKPLDVSLPELGISLTGNIPVVVKFTTPSFWEKMIWEVAPILLFFVVFLFFLRMMMPKWWGGLPFSFKVGKLDNKKKNKTKFSDVAGMEEVKNELSEVVDYLKHPEKYQKVGARHPKGVLLYGEPGSGKTLLARAVAGESDVAFFSASGSEFMEMLVGMWAAKVRELFTKAKVAGRAIIFIDEIDAIGKRRWSWYTGGHQEQEQTLNQILTEMDGFDTTTNIIVMAATNRPDTLDPALLRAGRFDRKVLVSRPTYEERLAIFEYYLNHKKIDKKVSVPSLAKRTSGLVGADIENIVNEASLKIAKESRQVILVDDFEYALEKVLMGPEKKTKSMNEQEKKTVAYHELGHAITAYYLPGADPVEKISIVRRGQALGMTWMTPEEDKNLYSRAKFLDEVVSLLGGRAAEELFLGAEHITTGASNDFEKATQIIRDMLLKYGMDKDLGTIVYARPDKDEYSFVRSYSEQTAQYIDKKTQEYMATCYAKAKDLITTNKDRIETLSRVLLEKEYLTKEEFNDMMQ